MQSSSPAARSRQLAPARPKKTLSEAVINSKLRKEIDEAKIVTIDKDKKE